jgi:hypothetical protein
MDSESSFSNGSQQNTFVKDSLKKLAADTNIDWIIVSIHRPFISGSTTHNQNEGGKADIYFPLFTQYGVDFVTQGHNHEYQRSFQIKDKAGDSTNPIIVNSSVNGPYTKGKGFVVVHDGRGGHDNPGSFYNIGTPPAWAAKILDDDDNVLNGYTSFTFSGTGNSTCTVEAWDINNDKLDSFSVVKP